MINKLYHVNKNHPYIKFWQQLITTKSELKRTFEKHFPRFRRKRDRPSAIGSRIKSKILFDIV